MMKMLNIGTEGLFVTQGKGWPLFVQKDEPCTSMLNMYGADGSTNMLGTTIAANTYNLVYI
jgi:hypothetical protein